MASLALGVVGAVAGSFVGQPELGFMLGSMVGTLLFPPKSPQPKINDIRVQNSAYGQHIPYVYGSFRLSGNLIWAGQPVQQDNSGKGGGKAPGQPTVSMSFAVSLCEGPIDGIRRIWANGKLIYDVSNPSNFQALSGSAQMVTNFTFYPGDENQLPDPTMESYLGVGNVPAHRGLSYVVFNNTDLSPWGNFLPSLSFEVIQGASPSWTSTDVASYGVSVANDIMGAPYLTAQGAEAVGYGVSGSYVGIQNGQMTAYGSVPLSSFVDAFGGFPRPTLQPYGSFLYAGNADEPGILATNSSTGTLTWYLDDGAFMISGITLATNGQASFLKQGLTLFATSSYGGSSFTIQKSTLVLFSTSVTSGLVTATSAIARPFVIVGASASYLYAADIVAGVLYQMDIGTLAVVNSWTNGFFQTVSVGYVVDDRHVYGIGTRQLWVFDAVAGTLNNLATFSTGYATYGPSSMAVISPSFILTASGQTPSNGVVQLGILSKSYGSLSNTATTLGAIVGDICSRAGLAPSQYDVSQLTDTVLGYAVTSHTTPRDALAQLLSAYFVDVSDTDGKLKFVKRGATPAGTFQWADLGASSSHGDSLATNPIVETIQQELDLPASLMLTYIGSTNDYQPGTQPAFRGTTTSNKQLAVNVALVLADDEALQRAQAMLDATWVARQTFQFKTGMQYLQYEPGDVMYLQAQSGQLYTVRIASCQYSGSGSLTWNAVYEYPGLYSSTAAGGNTSLGLSTNQVGYSGPTALAVLDVPPLRDQDTSQGLYLAACGYSPSWPGCAVTESKDGSSYTSVKTITAASPLGVATTALGNFSGGNIPDELNSVTVQLYSGSLSSVSYSDFLSGLNAAWLGGELLYFRTATLVAANTYALTGLLRGRVGTENKMAGHGVSDGFVFLDPTKLTAIGINLTDIGTKLYFEASLLNIFGATPGSPVNVTPATARVKPLSPVLFGAGHGSASSASDISLRWVRRARVGYQWVSGADVPLDESAETYQLSVSNAAGTVLRTLTVTGPFTAPTLPSYVYTAAQITADGFTSGQTINFSVAQNSDQGVLGWAATTSIAR